jgi:hypothetical protein
MTWTDDQTQKHLPLSSMMILAKVKMFAVLKEKAGTDGNVQFTANCRWFNQVKNC